MSPLRALALGIAMMLLASACGSESETPRTGTVRSDSLATLIVESPVAAIDGTGNDALATVDPTPLLVIGTEDGEEPYQLHRVSDALRLPDGRIAISNSGTSEIRLFDSTGRYLEKVGRRGAGPSEFAEFSTAAMYPAGDSVLAADNGVFRLHLFGPDMSFVETRRFELTSGVSRPFMRGVFADGSWLALSYAGGGALNGAVGSVIRSQYSLLRFTPNGRLLNVVATLDSRPRFVHQFVDRIHYPYLPLTGDPLDAVAGNEVFILRGPKPEIEVFDATGKLVRRVRWQRPATPASELWPSYKAQSLESMTEPSRASYAHYYDLPLPLPELAPSYSAMLVDAGRRIWLQRYRVDGDASAPTWDVLGQDGAWLGSVVTPAAVRIHRIGVDYLLGRHLDSLGVERVQLLRMRPHAMLASAAAARR